MASSEDETPDQLAATTEPTADEEMDRSWAEKCSQLRQMWLVEDRLQRAARRRVLDISTDCSTSNTTHRTISSPRSNERPTSRPSSPSPTSCAMPHHRTLRLVHQRRSRPNSAAVAADAPTTSSDPHSVSYVVDLHRPRSTAEMLLAGVPLLPADWARLRARLVGPYAITTTEYPTHAPASTCHVPEATTPTTVVAPVADKSSIVTTATPWAACTTAVVKISTMLAQLRARVQSGECSPLHPPTQDANQRRRDPANPASFASSARAARKAIPRRIILARRPLIHHAPLTKCWFFTAGAVSVEVNSAPPNDGAHITNNMEKDVVVDETSPHTTTTTTTTTATPMHEGTATTATNTASSGTCSEEEKVPAPSTELDPIPTTTTTMVVAEEPNSAHTTQADERPPASVADTRPPSPPSSPPSPSLTPAPQSSKARHVAPDVPEPVLAATTMASAPTTCAGSKHGNPHMGPAAGGRDKVERMPARVAAPQPPEEVLEHHPSPAPWAKASTVGVGVLRGEGGADGRASIISLRCDPALRSSIRVVGGGGGPSVLDHTSPTSFVQPAPLFGHQPRWGPLATRPLRVGRPASAPPVAGPTDYRVTSNYPSRLVRALHQSLRQGGSLHDWLEQDDDDVAPPPQRVVPPAYRSGSLLRTTYTATNRSVVRPTSAAVVGSSNSALGLPPDESGFVWPPPEDGGVARLRRRPPPRTLASPWRSYLPEAFHGEMMQRMRHHHREEVLANPRY